MQVLLKSTERLRKMFRLQMTIKVIAKPSAYSFSSFFFKQWYICRFLIESICPSTSGCPMSVAAKWIQNIIDSTPNSCRDGLMVIICTLFPPFPFLAFAKFWCNFVLSMQERFPFNNFPVMIISVLQSLLNVVEGLKWEKGLICNCSRKFSFSFWTKPNLQYCH